MGNMAVSSQMISLGTAAPTFSLPSVDGAADGITVRLEDFAEAPVLLVAFLCNHCPYVRHIEATLGEVIAAYADRGVAAVGVCSNDIMSYPDDAPEALARQRSRAGWRFPYLVDESQQVARAFGAACTPDLFLYGPDRRLVYRGAFDASTPGNGVRVTGELLRGAFEATLAGQPPPAPHRPSMGCGIKWK
jgi:peroxiredoxin